MGELSSVREISKPRVLGNHGGGASLSQGVWLEAVTLKPSFNVIGKSRSGIQNSQQFIWHRH